MELNVERVSVVVPVSAALLDDALDVPDYWALIREGWEAAIRDAEWLAAMRPAQRARVLRLRALIRRAVDDRQERERAERICPCCGHDLYECGDDW